MLNHMTVFRRWCAKWLEAEPLSRHCTLRVGGLAALFAAPATQEVFVDMYQSCLSHGIPVVTVGRASNVVFSDQGFDGVVLASQFLRFISFMDGCVRAGAGTPIQHLIRSAAVQGLGGIEFLFSVPGTLGGIVRMNAGRGKHYPDEVIGRFIERVTVFDGICIRELSASECRFGHRWSIFQENVARNWVILSAVVRLRKCTSGEVSRGIAKRIAHVRRTQDTALPNAGSIFADGYDDKYKIRGFRVGDGAYSLKTPNWIVNLGKATSADVDQLIQEARLRHPRPLRLEVVQI